jgi:Fic family protein
MAKKPIWLVTIVMPKKLMQEIQQGSLELESATLDLEDVEQAYEEGTDQAAEMSTDDQAELQNEQPTTA